MLPYIFSLLILVIAAILVVYLAQQQRKLSGDKAQLMKDNSDLSQEKHALQAQLDAQKSIYEAREAQWQKTQEKLDSERVAAQARLDIERTEALAQLKRDREEAQAKLEAAAVKLQEEREEAAAKLERERQEARDQIEKERAAAFASLTEQMENKFKLLSEQNSQALRQKNNESIAEILKPINEKFVEFDKAVRESQKESTEQNATMREMLDNMSKNMEAQTKTVGDEAKNLANALMGRAKVQGDFGEMILVDLLKQSGLQEGVQFVTQSVIRDENGHEVKSEEGATMIPDVIVRYPDNTDVIIDSKLSLSDYVRYQNATSLEERVKYAKAHIASITKHIEELRSKDYASYIEEDHKKTDYNIMFIPNEGAFRLMLDQEPLLWQEARKNKVLIVSQMNLMVLLNMITLSWKRYDQEKNIKEVYNTSQELMSQLRGWLDSFNKLGEHLDKAHDAFVESRHKLQNSNQSVFKKIAKLEKLNVAPKRSNTKFKVSSRAKSESESIVPLGLIDNTAQLEDE